MIDSISSWTQQIIIAVIIGTIIELILPKGNSRKYIKTVIGIYILYTIISPIISAVSGSFELDLSEYEKYFETEDIEYETSANLYEEEIEKQIENSIENVNISVNSISIYEEEEE